MMISLLRCLYLAALLSGLVGWSGPAAAWAAPNRGLSVWIEEGQVKEFVGFPMEIFVIKDDYIASYLQTPGFDQHLPIIPADVNLVNLTWESGQEQWYYWFQKLRSLDHHIMYHPLLDIPVSGKVPQYKSGFQMAIPCTGRVTGIATLHITLHLYGGRGSIPGSPINLLLRKQCTAFALKMCGHECKHGGTCNDAGVCECRPGYIGKHCEQAVCHPVCENNGSCVAPDVCICPAGYEGPTCAKAVCTMACMNDGKCIGPERCSCRHGFHGKQCQISFSKCRKPCGHGKCVALDTCKCDSGYHGRFCNRKHNDPYYAAIRRHRRARRERRLRERHLKDKLMRKG